VGKKYEVVATTNDGLWRYQLNDIVKVAGFTCRAGRRNWYLHVYPKIVTHLTLLFPGRDPAQAIAIVKAKLQADMGYAKYSEGENIIGDPTIRILKPGTFKEYRHWKAETSGINSG